MEPNTTENSPQLIIRVPVPQSSSTQSEEQRQKLKEALTIEQKRLDRLSSQLQTAKQQIEFYTQEYQLALENIKDCNWKLTKEMCTELRKLENPSKGIIEVCEKVMLALDQPEKTFDAFKTLIRNFGYFKDLMTAIQGQSLPESIINDLLPVWKNQTIIQAKISKSSRCAALLAQWLGFVVEFTLKKETVYSSKRKLPEIEKKFAAQSFLVADLKNEMCKVMENTCKSGESSGAKGDSWKQEELSEKFEGYKETQAKPFGFTMQKGTASGGILASALYSNRESQGFPNFNDEELYGGIPVKESSASDLVYEGDGEAIGCCRSRFFCF
jgi:uncharacterized protein YbgA (DUF1722 family)